MYRMALKLPNAVEWKKACATEVASLIENKVLNIVDKLAHKQTVTSKWVFKKKRGILEAVEKYKARLVARGFTKKEGIDYNETFSSYVSRASDSCSLRLHHTKSTQLRWM